MPDRPLSTPGRRPYGDQPGERSHLERMVRLRQSRHTWQAIADRLNASGSTRRNGTAWTPSAVANIVTRHLRSQVD